MDVFGLPFQPLSSSLLLAAFVLLVLGLRSIFRYRLPPRLMMVVWTLVGIRLLVPFSLPEHSLPEALRSSFVVHTEEALPTSVVTIPERAASALLGHYKTRAEALPEIAAFSLKIRKKQNERLLLTFWLLGAIGVFACRQYAFHSTIRHVEKSLLQVKDLRLVSLVRRCTRETGRSTSVPVFYSASAAVPFCCGIFRPKIVIPLSMRSFPLDRLRHIILHELGHISRRDLLSIQLWEVGVALNWFNPVVWLARHAMQRDQEFACDAFVYRITGRENAGDYAETLVEVASHVVSRREAGAFSLAMAGRRKTQIRERVEFALDTETQRPSILLGALVLFIGLLVLPTVASHRVTQTKEVQYFEAAVDAALLDQLEERLKEASQEYPEVAFPLPSVDMRKDWTNWSSSRRVNTM